MGPVGLTTVSDYSIFAEDPEMSGHAVVGESDDTFENEQNNQDQKAASCCGNPAAPA